MDSALENLMDCEYIGWTWYNDQGWDATALANYGEAIEWVSGPHLHAWFITKRPINLKFEENYD